MKGRPLKHPKYYAIEGHMILRKKTYEQCAAKLNLGVRTYKEKIAGYYDFTAEQGRVLAEYLGVTQDELFLI